MSFILGKKIGMSQIFDENGIVIPVTLIEAGPCVVTQLRKVEIDGYESAQIGFGEKKSKNINKALKGHFGKVGRDNIKLLREFKLDGKELKVGDVIDVSVFSEGGYVNVSGKSKGRGFQGVVKRHGFKGGPKSHGHRHVLRTPGSTGSRFPQHTRKGRRMAGQTGNARITVKNLKVTKIDKESNLMAIKGAIPGHRGTLLEIISAR